MQRAIRKLLFRSLLAISAFASSATSARAGLVDRSRAARAARGWHKLRFRDTQKFEVGAAEAMPLFVAEAARPIVAKGRTIAYAFDTPGGCIAIATDDEQAPVFYYSLRHRLAIPGVPPAQAIMEAFADKMAQFQDNRHRKTSAPHPLWDSLTGLAEPDGAVDTLAAFLSGPTGPLLTTTWSQDEPYNNQCPMYYGQRCVVGCVATAMAQIMRYWKHPATGVGSHCYYWALGGTAPCADFGSTTYDWDNMPSQLTAASSLAAKDAVGTLCYHCGVSVEMDYGPYGSAAWHFRAAAALTKYFGYEPTYFLGQTGNINLQVWYDMMREQIDKGQPVMYGTEYHEFVLDGYDAPNLVHFNMGWGGEEDGWYAIDYFPLGSYMVDAVVEIQPHQLEVLEMQGITKIAGGNVRLRWTSRPGDAYTVRSCVDLRTGEWIEEANVSSQGVTTSWTDPTPIEDMKFYRVEKKQ